MESYAIVQASGKQFWIEEDKFYDFDKLPLDNGDTFSLNQILLVCFRQYVGYEWKNYYTRG